MSNYAHQKEIDDLNVDFEERNHLYIPPVNELTRTVVYPWDHKRKFDLTEIHRLKTALDASEKQVASIQQELNALKYVKKQMLMEMNRVGFATVQVDSEFRQKQIQLKEEHDKLAKDIIQQ